MPQSPDVQTPPQVRGRLLGAQLALLGLAVFIVVLAVTHQSSDTDFWQHIRVGQAIWDARAIPSTNVWTWPTYGTPYDAPSWLFRVLIWPFWAALGERGLDLWRWLTAVGLFALLFAGARRAAKGQGDGLPTLAVLAWSALLWRYRWEMRPETLAALLLALEIWLLERRRNAPAPSSVWRDSAWWLVPLQLVWINAHISYYLGFVVIVAFFLDGLWKRSRGDETGRPMRLLLVMLAAGVACFANPYGLRAIIQPFDFFLHGRTEPIFRYVDELQPLEWSENIRNGAPFYLVALVGLAIMRWRKGTFDAAQAVLLAVLLPQAFATKRFLAVVVIATAPMFARDVELLFARMTPVAIARSAWGRALLLGVPLLVLSGLEFTRTLPPFGLGVRGDGPPARACDYMAEHDVRGRGYNMFWQGGYLLWRFWPDRGRLPFMDIAQTGSRADRDMQVFALTDSTAWQALDARCRFDWILLPTTELPIQHLMGWLDADTSRWGLVFSDDVASLFLRRDGSCASLVESQSYQSLRMGNQKFVELQYRALSDSLLRRQLHRELDRAVASSPWDSRARSMRASVALMEARWNDARADLETGLKISPGLERAYDRLAFSLIMSGHPAEAIDAIERGRKWGMSKETADQLTLQAQQAIGRGPH